MKTDSKIVDAVNEAFAEAHRASMAAMPQYDRADACGFGWVIIKPARGPVARYLKDNGLARAAYGGGLQVWNPGKTYSQSITVAEEGARAFARVLRERLGVDAQADSRMD